MEEEGGEPVEEEEVAEEAGEAPPRKGKGKLIAIVAIVLAALLTFTAVYFLFLANAPPAVSFSTTSTDTHLFVNAETTTDVDDPIASYVWNWGDQSPASSGNLVRADHVYAQAGTFTVTLTATDARGASGTASHSVTLLILPTPFFLARQSGLTTSFDASQTQASQGHSILSYSWNFGDGTTDTSRTTTHTYANPGRYVVNLTVTQDNNVSNSVSHYVSANYTTVDVLANQFFVSGCPFRNYWSLRFRTYGDQIVRDAYPCTDYYPWILYKNSPSTNPSWVYSLYRFDARVTNHTGYSVWDPVILPVFNATVAPSPNSFIRMNFTFDYLTNQSIAYWDRTSWPVNPKYSDGFGYLVLGSVTMDLQESKRVFGVVASSAAEAQSWWYANTKYGGANVGALENKTGVWLDQEGNGKYDIWNGFQWYYESDIADLNATVNPSNGNTTVNFLLDGWGFEVLWARWSYWGAASYHDAVCVAGQGTCTVTRPYGAIKPAGWMPFETCWCENASANLTITNSMNLDYQATSEYWFSAVGNPGADGQLCTGDDLAGWSFGATLMDYVPRFGSGQVGQSSYPNSELRWYESSTAYVTSPGSYAYGLRFEYMVVPSRWNMSLGNTLTLLLPTGKVPFYDPVKSFWDSVHNIGNYTTFDSTLTLRDAAVSPKVPGQGYYLWDNRGKVLSMAGPPGFVWPNANQAPLDSAPYFEFAPETVAG